MKNKRSMLIISAMVLLLAVVLGMGGTTFAKYVSTKTPLEPASATVAKWGWLASADADELFVDAYTVTADKFVQGDGFAIRTNSGVVVGPGANGFVTFSITGSAEVATRIQVTLAGSDIFYDEDGSGNEKDPYYPIVWTLTKEGNATPLTSGTFEQVKTWITNNLTEDVGATESTDTLSGTYKLAYEWAFEQGHDDYDTILGERVNAGTADEENVARTTVTLSLSVKFTQIDEDPNAAP